MTKAESVPSDVEMRFDISREEPEVQAAVEALAQDIIRENPVTREESARFFQVDPELVGDHHLAYLEAYKKVVVRQLVIGAYFGPNYDIRGVSLEHKLDALKKRGSTLLFSWGSGFWHDVAHSVVAIGRSEEKSKPMAAIPLFQMYTQNGDDYKDEDERRRMMNDMAIDELIADLFGFLSRDTLKERIEKRSLEEFLTYYGCGSTDLPQPFAKRLLTKLHREYATNPMVLFDIFFEETREFMEANAGSDVTQFRKQARIKA